MATLTFNSVEDYLQAPYEGLEPDFIDGEVIDRAMPMLDHSCTRSNMIFEARRFAEPLGWLVAPELRLNVGPERRLIPDISIYTTRPAEQVPSAPGLAAIEIFSPDDRWSDVRRKLKLLWDWGIPHVWAVDPEPRALYVYGADGFHQVQRLEIPEHGFALTAEQIFR